MKVLPDTPLPLHMPPNGVATRFTIVSVRQTTSGALTITIGVIPANTVIVNVLGVPAQPLAVGVTVIVATCVTPLTLVTTNGLIVPVPLAARPIEVLLFVQLNTVPVVAPLNVIVVVVPPVQSAWLAIAFTVGVGFTVIVNVIAVPVQPFAVVGVTVIVAVIGAAVLLVAVKLGILPWPVAASPIAVLEFVQLNIVPATVPTKFTAAVAAPLHNVWLATAATVAFGLTVIVNVIGNPAQPFALGVTVIVPDIAVTPVLVVTKLGIFPVPDAPRPIAVFELVHANVVPGVKLVKFTAAVLAPAQSVWFATGATTGVGFTVMVNVVGVPAQPLAVGVTVIVAVTGELVVFVAVKAAILPVPLAARPIDVLLFVQLNVVPATAPVKVIAVVVAPLHNVWLATAFTVGVGFTVMVNVIGVPVQVTPLLVNVGVTVIVATTGAVPVLIAVKLGMFPVPAAARPILVLLFVQLYTVPAALPVKVTAAVGAPLHTAWLATALTVGTGFTVIVKVIVGPVQVTAALVYVGVTVIVATTGAPVAFVAVKLAILPVPAAARPIDGALLVQL